MAWFFRLQDIRKSISANVHVKALLCKLASELTGGVEDESRPEPRINLHTVEATHKVVQKLEVTVKVRITHRGEKETERKNVDT